MLKYYCEDAESVLREVGSSEKGLSAEEAAKRLERDGRNELAAAKKPSLISQFFKQIPRQAVGTSRQNSDGHKVVRQIGQNQCSARAKRQCGRYAV